MTSKKSQISKKSQTSRKNWINNLKKTVSVPLRFHWSVIVLPLLLLYYNGLLGIPLFLMLFGSLLFHEYAHVWAAQRQRLYVPYVIAHGFGAVAGISGLNVVDYKQNLKIAVAGPIGSFLLFGLGIPLHMAFQSPWTGNFIFINFILGIFNLLPMFPSDGGRILYSLLGMKIGGFKAIKIAVYTSWILCGIGMLIGILTSSLWLMIIMGLLIYLSIQEKAATEARLQGSDNIIIK